MVRRLAWGMETAIKEKHTGRKASFPSNDPALHLEINECEGHECVSVLVPLAH